ncbi:MAG: hypothetical protein JWL64_2585 [Frankiales bacterium]|nr:hypothetical protein [Frankiales bacterium]
MSSQAEQPRQGSATGGEGGEGGDPACWLQWVCDGCGAIAEDPAAQACARCGAELSPHE